MKQKLSILLMIFMFCDITHIESCTTATTEHMTTTMTMTTIFMTMTTEMPITIGWQNNSCDWFEYNYKWYPMHSPFSCRLNCTRTNACTHYSYLNLGYCYIYFGPVIMDHKVHDSDYVCGSII